MIRPEALRQFMFAESLMGGLLFDFICGELIGFGMSRAVFEYKPDPKCVVKIQYEQGNGFQNVLEHETWDRVSHTELARWFAPVRSISDCGRFLVQAKTHKLAKYPDRVPAFFTDLHEGNWGLYKGRAVCHDYGLHLMLEKGMTKRMRKADWRAFTYG